MSGRTSASAIAMDMLRKRVEAGATITFPSLGIELTAANLKGDSMSDTDTTDHAAAIREATDRINHATADEWGGTDHWQDLNAIRDHADALAARLADAEARAARLRELADARGVLLSLASPPPCVRSLPRPATLSHWLDAMERYNRAKTDCRKHGDLDPEVTPQATPEATESPQGDEGTR